MLFIPKMLSRPLLRSPHPLLLSVFATSLGAALSAHTFAAVTVASPVNGTKITSPAWIRAHNTGCEGVPPSAFGYSIDSASGTVMGATPNDIDVTSQAIPSGSHTVHFKSWTSRGACPTVNSTVTVVGTSAGGSGVTNASGGSDSIPANAVSSGDLDGRSNWLGIHDGGTPGSAKGSTVYPASTPLYDDARKFYMTYTDRAGERWSLNFGKDSEATHFVLDTYVFLTNPSQVENLELDINQVIPNGETVILGTQCSGEIGKWEYAYTSGKEDHWKSTNISCDPKSLSANQWHHIQIGMHRDNNGVVTHDWVNVDSTHNVFTGEPMLSEHSLGWSGGALVANYQIEGSSAGSGSVTTYIHKMTVYRW